MFNEKLDEIRKRAIWHDNADYYTAEADSIPRMANTTRSSISVKPPSPKCKALAMSFTYIHILLSVHLNRYLLIKKLSTLSIHIYVYIRLKFHHASMGY